MQNVLSSKAGELKKININPKKNKRYKTSSSSINQIRELQQTIGNQEVAKLIESGELENVLNGNKEIGTDKLNKIEEDIQKNKSDKEENQKQTKIDEAEEIRNKLNEAIDIAYSKGLINTGNFLYHFLENNGRNLEVDVDAMLQNIKGFKEELNGIIDEAKENALIAIKKSKSDNGLNFELKGDEKKYNFSKSNNEDYYNILNKFNYSYKAQVVTFSASDIPEAVENASIPKADLDAIKSKGSEKLAFIKLSINLDNRFDKFFDNSINLGRLEIRNEDLNKLVKSDMANGFDIRGKSSDSYLIWEYDTSKENVPEDDKEKIEDVKDEIKEEENQIENEPLKKNVAKGKKNFNTNSKKNKKFL